MNSDSEAFQRHLIAWLLQDPASTAAPEYGECNRIDGVEEPLADAAVQCSAEGSGFSPQPFELGDIPAVQDRFYAVLKRRLQIEIQQHPPRFPWETEGFDYPDRVDAASVEPIPAPLWMVQQQNLRLPIPLPEPVFRRLLNQCQVVGRMASSQLGAKLVQAVQDLFPGESQTLNHLAGVVLMSPSRGPATPPGSMLDIDGEYSALYPLQQMVLSLLAARQLLDTLTMVVSSTEPVVDRQWLTAAGMLSLQAEYQRLGGVPQLRVQAELPCGGSLKLQSGSDRATAQRSDSGYLSVELHQPQLSQNCPLEVQFPYTDQDPLIFTICPTV